jgi:hypothetical protein
VHEGVEHDAREREHEALSRCAELELEVLREGGRKTAPYLPLSSETVHEQIKLCRVARYTVRIQFERSPHFLNKFAGLRDDLSTRVGHDSRHLH